MRKLTFVRDILSNEGIRPRKVSAIENMPRPQCKKDVQRFNGKINYTGKFIINVSETHGTIEKPNKKENKKGFES